MIISGSIPIGRPTKGEFPVLIKTRNKKINYFLWRRLLGLAIINVYFSNGINIIVDRLNQKLPMKFGHLRFRWRLFLINIMRVAVRQAPFRVTFSIDNASITSVSTGDAEHMKYHVIGHGDFNKLFASGYKFPTTSGTAPLDRATYAQFLVDNVKDEYLREFHKDGLIL